MDEFGTSIRHNDEATVKCAPFYYMQTGVMFSIIWLEKNLEMGGKWFRKEKILSEMRMFLIWII